MSIFEFKLPELGDGIAEAEIMTWLVGEGEQVSEHQGLVEVQTDKAIIELTAPVTGILKKHGTPVGQIITLDEVLATFVLDSADTSSVQIAPPPEPASADAAAPPTIGETQTPQAREAATTEAGMGRRPLAAPVVRKLARELDVDLTQVSGSGPGGRILRGDVESFTGGVEPAQGETILANGSSGPVSTTPHAIDVRGEAEGSVPAASEPTPGGGTRRIPLRGLRRAIARRMTETLHTVPHVTGLIEIDVTDLQDVLRELRPAAEAEGVRLTWTAFFALATIQALRQFPDLNASLDSEHEEIVLHDRVHLGVATATEHGLLVPVVRNADQMSLLELASEIGRVSAAARDRSATPSELAGSTFTITNYGAVGGWHGTPMVNVPEIGIVGFGSVAPRPAVVDGALAVRTMVALSHTVDHRLIDGAVNAQFGAAIRRRLEQPQLLMLGAIHGHG
ncbi:pyruvate dehydrogenase E2 component (dihydrolipoamide acetyltransferase) [Arthrobacter sp. SLBN-100]|uniref:dihydrolipoamide acetyltransferase family protein n=1 Tax=Arthrobacter sp. SLBN-100 TaxID=2768450 RepID=UPI001153FF18|nr:dihydrolipoamide acetyltransferase family protein [Arthrobacter sp. SLBN-100]TQJ62219.1 pyruvate dehydrogenase E2 component (dihydrolipoamide acetyltransferase) [Arthrobacter sp. SLBN-100]